MSEPSPQPNYADQFRCIGPDCEQSCCAGWGAYVDKATYKKYRETPGLRQAAARHIELNRAGRDAFRYARIKFRADGRCPFLADDNLCEIQKQHGAAYLSRTCAQYPRALVSFDGGTQRALYLSCPEAARLVLLSPQLLPERNGKRYLPTQDSAPSPEASAVTRALREFALDVLQDRSYPLWQRLLVLGIVCQRVQEPAAPSPSGSTQLLAQYGAMLREGSLRPSLDGIPARPGLQLELVLRLIRGRFQLEQPDRHFAELVAEFLRAIGHSPETPAEQMAARYQDAYVGCLAPFEDAYPCFLENYVLNHIFRARFPFAELPGEPQRSAEPLTSYVLLALHYRVLHSLLMGAAARRGRGFSSNDAVRVVHSFARGVEHHPAFCHELEKFAHAPELRQTDGMALLLRN